MQKLELNKHNIVIVHEETIWETSVFKEILKKLFLRVAQEYDPGARFCEYGHNTSGSRRGAFFDQVSTYCQQLPCPVEVVVSEQSGIPSNANK
jgi:hypothetical protein